MVFRKINSWLRTKQEPKLQDAYRVFHNNQVIASLDNPVVEDQFWVSFTLTALTTSHNELTFLYDDRSWNHPSFVIKERESERAVSFLLFPEWEETEDKVIVRNFLKDKPERILMRGPYPFHAVVRAPLLI